MDKVELNKLEELKKSLAALETGIKEGKEKFKKALAGPMGEMEKEGEDEEESCEDCEELREEMGSAISYLYDSMYNVASNLRESIYSLEGAIYKHNSNASVHLPGFTAGQLQKLIETCGAEKDVRVEPRVVYASKSVAVEASYKKK